MMRPAHLPDYKFPPLNEVVLGVQFSQIEGYHQILAGEVWNLYRGHYPKVEEQPALAPVFETFGGRAGPLLQFGFMAGANHDRFWFVAPDKAELIQFQADRLLHNWRKTDEGDNPYPHFEQMIEKFTAELKTLQDYFLSLSKQRLQINQCEVSYINQINLSDSRDLSEWLRFLTFPDICKPDDISFTTRRALNDKDGKPWGRLFIEGGSGINRFGGPTLQVTLTVRGAPFTGDIDSAVQFIGKGREVIVTTFAEIMTDDAQKKWERIQ